MSGCENVRRTDMAPRSVCRDLPEGSTIAELSPLQLAPNRGAVGECKQVVADPEKSDREQKSQGTVRKSLRQRVPLTPEVIRRSPMPEDGPNGLELTHAPRQPQPNYVCPPACASTAAVLPTHRLRGFGPRQSRA